MKMPSSCTISLAPAARGHPHALVNIVGLGTAFRSCWMADHGLAACPPFKTLVIDPFTKSKSMTVTKMRWYAARVGKSPYRQPWNYPDGSTSIIWEVEDTWEEDHSQALASSHPLQQLEIVHDGGNTYSLAASVIPYLTMVSEWRTHGHYAATHFLSSLDRLQEKQAVNNSCPLPSLRVITFIMVNFADTYRGLPSLMRWLEKIAKFRLDQGNPLQVINFCQCLNMEEEAVAKLRLTVKEVKL
ncbi:hypothetical protein BKA70DRAFT_764171 [Coprinopsis sp. MPI-PUGE-AT-0042]|nr:hypothetical protein BKA70DRAFT_764171 [Coprinopsis sp. MPI-PUGE-AT-0042]